MKIYDYSCDYRDGLYPTVTMKLFDVNGQEMVRIRDLTSKGCEIKIERDTSDWITSLLTPNDILKGYTKEDVEATSKMLGGFTYNKNRELKVTKVIFNNPATIVFWSDGTKTVVKCGENDTYDKEKGFYIACAKKLFGNDYKAVGRMNKALEMAVIQMKEAEND